MPSRKFMILSRCQWRSLTSETPVVEKRAPRANVAAVKNWVLDTKTQRHKRVKIKESRWRSTKRTWSEKIEWAFLLAETSQLLTSGVGSNSTTIFSFINWEKYWYIPAYQRCQYDVYKYGSQQKLWNKLSIVQIVNFLFTMQLHNDNTQDIKQGFVIEHLCFFLSLCVCLSVCLCISFSLSFISICISI